MTFPCVTRRPRYSHPSVTCITASNTQKLFPHLGGPHTTIRPVLLINPLIRYGLFLRTIWLNGIRLKRGFGFDALAASPNGLSWLSFVRGGGSSVGGDHGTIFVPSLIVRPLDNVRRYR